MRGIVWEWNLLTFFLVIVDVYKVVTCMASSCHYCKSDGSSIFGSGEWRGTGAGVDYRREMKLGYCCNRAPNMESDKWHCMQFQKNRSHR